MNNDRSPERVVLYVDDDRARQETVRTSLDGQWSGDTLSTTAAGNVLERCEQTDPDCVVSRYSFPETDGIEVLDTVRDCFPELPFVLFPEDGSEALAERAIAAGVTAYVRDSGSDRYERLAARIDDAIGTTEGGGWQTLFDSLDESVHLYDPERDDPSLISRAVCEHWDHESTECYRRIPDELPSATDQAVSRSIDDWIERTRNGGGQRLKFPCVPETGREFWAEVTLDPVTVQGRNRLVVLTRDITAQQYREQRLRAFREAVEHAGHSIYITDTDGEIRYVNGTFEETTGYSASESIGETPALLKSGEHDEEYYEDLWTTILDGDAWQNEIVNEHKDGSRYVVNQTIAPILDESGEPVRFVAVNADITEQKRREKQLQTLYEATTEWLDADSKADVCTMVSSQLESLLEFDEHGFHLYDESTGCLEPVAVSMGGIVAAEDVPAFGEDDGIAWSVFESGEPQHLADVRDHTDVYNSDTDVRSELLLPLGNHGVLLIGSRQPDAFSEADETIAKVLASTLGEVFSRIDRETELQRQNSRLEEFANLVSHDLRNPLSVARTHLELAEGSGDLGHLDDIRSAHDRMERIIDDLLWLAREGRAIGETHPVELQQVVENAWSHVDTADATLSGDCSQTIVADEDRVTQLFENLFRNAIEHGSTEDSEATDTDIGADVQIGVGLLDNGFYVEDDGPGIPADRRDRVLEPGYSTAEESTGYGLAIVSRIADAHGWDVTITESDDGGARFEMGNVETADETAVSWTR